MFTLYICKTLPHFVALLNMIIITGSTMQQYLLAHTTDSKKRITSEAAVVF